LFINVRYATGLVSGGITSKQIVAGGSIVTNFVQLLLSAFFLSAEEKLTGRGDAVFIVKE
jgi:hypothetical protein